jgi:transposase
MLADIDHLTSQIQVPDARIAVLCQPYERQIAQLDGIPGFAVTAARDLIAGIGTGMSVFPAPGHLASRARVAPGVREPAGKRKGKNAAGRGNPYIGAAPGETSTGAGRTQTFPGARYRRMCTRMPENKAQGAIMRTQPVIARALLSDPGARYQDPGTDYCERRADIRRRIRSHVRSLESPGCKVTVEAPDPGTGEYLPIATAS